MIIIYYVAHGFGLLILSQNMTALGKSWSVPLKLVSFVYLGMACYLAFALGIPFSKKVYLAVGILACLLVTVLSSACDKKKIINVKQ